MATLYFYIIAMAVFIIAAGILETIANIFYRG